MTNNQKLIKIFAQVFGVFLTILIISFITSCVYGIGNLLKKSEKNNFDVVSCDNYKGDINEIIINTIYSNLDIKKADSFKMESNYKVKCSVSNGSIKIEDKNKWKKIKIVLYLPDVSSVKIDSGAGILNIDDLNCDNVKLSLGAGLTNIKNINARYADIDTGAGKLVIKNGNFDDLDFDMGVGSSELNINVNNDVDIDAGVGNLDLYLIGSKMDYIMKISKGIGNIIVDGENVKSGIIGDGKKTVKIDGGIGNIKVNFINNEKI